MKMSVIVSTYNQPLALEKVLWGYTTQAFTNFELLIADDGSSVATLSLVKRLRIATGLDIKHVWHPDEGFRKCVILNRAIAQADGEYLVFTDGDCIPHPEFLAQHARHARPGIVLSGGCVRLPQGLSQKISMGDVRTGRATQPSWLLSQGLRSPRSLMKSAFTGHVGGLLDRITPTRATFNGCNTSVAKDAVVKANGFDQRMQYGGLDRELGERLENAGLVHRHVRYRACCIHLWHARPYMTQESWARNREIQSETRRTKATWTPFGIQPSCEPAPSQPLKPHEHRAIAQAT